MFGMADVYAALFIMIGVLLSYPALLVVLRFLFPDLVGKAATRLQKTPWVCVLIGIPVAGVLTLVVAGLIDSAGGPLQAFGGALGLMGLSLAAFGAAGMAEIGGQRIAAMSNQSPLFRHYLIGAFALTFASIFPLLGWFVFFPFGVAIAFGAATLAIARPYRAEEAVPAQPNPERIITVHSTLPDLD